MNAERSPELARENLARENFTRASSRQLGSDAIKAAERPGPATNNPEQASRKYSPVLTMSDFADVYDLKKIRSDERYCAQRRGLFTLEAYAKAQETGTEVQSEEAKLSNLFEKVFVRGLQVGRWLGDQPATLRSYQTAEYDDTSHRVDAFTTLKFRNPIETEAGVNLKQLPLGFDVVIDDKFDRISEKLTKHYNHNAELPFGYSQLDYYTDGQTKGPLDLLPRYVIGVGGTEVNAVARSMQGKTPDLHAPRVLITRFKVLSEIRAENKLYQAMLPDEAAESDDLRLRKAAAYLEVANTLFNRALNRCTQDLVAYKALPNAVLKQLEDVPQTSKKRKIIEEYLLQQAHQDHVERMRDRHRSKGTYYVENEDPNDDTFVQILKQTRQLTEAAQAGHSALQAHRGLGVHNQKIRV